MKTICRFIVAILFLIVMTPFYLLGLSVGWLLVTCRTGFSDGVDISVGTTENIALWVRLGK